MFKGRRKGQRYQGSYGGGLVEKVPLKGLFSDGGWKCNCDPRLPAQRFQTKNGGPNHGRWFYTCQRPQPTRCDFFLWENDAKPREMVAVLNNSRTEPSPAAPHTPTKNHGGGYMTPETTVKRSGSRFRVPETAVTPSTPSKSSGQAMPRTFPPSARSPTESAATAQEDDDEDDEEYFDSDWPASHDAQLSKTATQVSNRAMPPPPETPRKTAKTDSFPTPGKRSYDEMSRSGTSSATTSSPATLRQDDDVFTTPSTTKTPNLFTSTIPTSPGYPLLPPSSPPHDSDLTAEILQCLATHHITPLSADLTAAIRAIGTRHSLHTRGVTKGRDISRAQIARNNEKIAKLQADIAALQADRETTKAVTRHLRRELGELEAEKEKG